MEYSIPANAVIHGVGLKKGNEFGHFGRLRMAGKPGFEPGLLESESRVLPLNYFPINIPFNTYLLGGKKSRGIRKIKRDPLKSYGESTLTLFFYEALLGEHKDAVHAMGKLGIVGGNKRPHILTTH